MSDLPAPVAEAGLLFQRATVMNDPAAYRRIIDWGYYQIDLAYPEDPIRAPLNVIRRLRARQEWDKVVRTAGKELRGTIMNAMVRQLEFEIQRRETNILADDAEGRRQTAVRFDGDQRISEHERISRINQQLSAEQMRLAHTLSQEAEDKASARRIKEMIAENVAKIQLLLIEAQVKAAGTSEATKTIETVNRVNAEITVIRNDPHLTDDDKHVQIKTFLDTLPRILRGVRADDV